ncbi:MAG: hypothetical protein IJ839_04420 [Ruminobacter sp.]|nr:hypothetical protein [Ruminobacter sp.]
MTETTKNIDKFRSYAFAFSRINQAIENEFPLEAITMEESIICDRLRAYKEANGLSYKNNDGLYKFLDDITKDLNNKDKYHDLSELLTRINSWRDDRNKTIHRVVRTNKSGESPDLSHRDFIPHAIEVAKTGSQLAREICTISKKLRREAEKKTQDSVEE